MKILYCVTVLLAIVMCFPAQAAEPLVVYDNFKGKLFSPKKWFGAGGGDAILEATREIQGSRLRLSHRSYASTESDSGSRGGVFGLGFPKPATVMAVAADIQVTKFQTVGCATNPSVDVLAGAEVVRGAFFNAGTPEPGSALNDVEAVMEIIHRPTDGALAATAFYVRCDDATCATSTLLDFKELGPVNLGQTVKLLLQWDRSNHRFIFQKDAEPQVFSSYTMSDTAPPANPGKILGLSRVVPNCTTGPRPVAFMEAWFDNILVNASAVP